MASNSTPDDDDFDLIDWLLSDEEGWEEPERHPEPVATGPVRVFAHEEVDDEVPDGFAVFDLTKFEPVAPQVLWVGDDPLPAWAAARPHTARWDCGWWTDSGPLHHTAPPERRAPAGTPVARFALPSQAAGHWGVLHGQIVGKRRWVLALDGAGEVAGVFFRAKGQVAQLLGLLGVADPKEPEAWPWTLRAGA